MPERARPADGAEGWDQYAPFYDWENAQTVGRRDVAFWTRLAAVQQGGVLELGCGTGRIYDLKAQEKLQFVKDGNRLKFRRSWLDAYLDGAAA